ncbi:MAG TPA: hypothetical protein DEP87_04650, partial [Candidatus Pacebacteria bacterium]|nr:hypothetical protein [Candidatus Paceibacterota bacterium]
PPARWRTSWIWLWGLSLSLAVSFSYSAVPAVLVIGLGSLIWWRQAAGKLWLSLVIGLGLWNLPTAVFELRHGFLLTHMLIFGPWIEQIPSTLISRWTDLAYYLVNWSAPMSWIKLTSLIWLGLVFYHWVKQLWQWRQWQQNQLLVKTKQTLKNYANLSPLFIWTAGWWLGTMVLTLILPVAVQAHYVFTLIVLSLASLVLLPSRLKWGLITLLVVGWLQPAKLNSYWQPARHSLAELTQCSAQICETVTEPTFVSNQAGAHSYHNAMEYQYLLRQAGCQLRDVANFPTSAQLMVVVLDDSVYEHNQTAFNELTLFGKSQVTQEIECGPKLKALVLKKP